MIRDIDTSPPHGPVEALALLGLGLAASVALRRLAGDGAPSAAVTFAPAAFAVAWVGPAWWLAERRGVDALVAHGLAVRPRGLAAAAAVVGAVFGLFLAAAALLCRRAPTVDPGAVAAEAASILAWGGLLVALPEEWFFRGVLQPALDGPGGVRVLGARLGRGALLGALLFGAAHGLVDVLSGQPLHPWRLLTAAPGLLFAWLRERTGGVLAPTVAHAAADALERVARAVWVLP